MSDELREVPDGAISSHSFDAMESSDVEVEEEVSSSGEHSHYDMPEVFACSLCRKSYSSKNHLKRHMKSHVDAQYHCLECGKSFTWKGGLTVHMRTHTKERPYCCEDCGKTFTDKSWLNSHRIGHTGEMNYLCEICGKLYRKIGSLKKHIESVHGFEPECKTCKAKFVNKKEWQEHMKANLSHKQLTCPHCPQRFTSYTSRYHHIRNHLKEKSSGMDSERQRFTCKKCNKKYLTKQSIREHSCIDRFCCWRCKKQFKTAVELDLHKQRSHNKKETKKICQKCGKKFGRPYLLKRHKCKLKVIPKELAIPIAVMKTDGNPQILLQILKPEEGNPNPYCKRCLVPFPSKYCVHVCASPNLRKSFKKDNPKLRKQNPTAEETGSGEAFGGLKVFDTPVKKETSTAECTPFPITEIRELDGNQQSSQEMTFFFKFEGRDISILRP